MRLYEVLDRVPMRPVQVTGDVDLGPLTADSREVQPGSCFVLMPSSRGDSNPYLRDAAAKGATVAIVGTSEGFQLARELGLMCAQFPSQGHSYTCAMSYFGRAYYGDPSSPLKVIGVTGTNGKTTTAYLISGLLQALNVSTATLGTVGFSHPGGSHQVANTTPFPIELWSMIAEARRAGAEALVMEVSSHALTERRVAGLRLDVGVFTNLSQDHLDYHGTMERYAEAKRLLFTEAAVGSGKRFVAAINVDDPVGAEYASVLAWPCVDFGIESGSVRFTIDEVSPTHIRGRMPSGMEFTAPLGGAFNAQNIQAAAAAMIALGYSESEIAPALGKVRPVPGRFESVPNTAGIHVIVDYAHTPDALEKLLLAARAVNPRRIITVFGCGGDRDKTKRPLMARAASDGSDVVIATSDNPRTEDPVAILEDVRAGLTGTFELIVERPQAVRRAVELAEPGDLVVLAGKGHEDYQIIGTTKVPMDDRELAMEALALR